MVLEDYGFFDYSASEAGTYEYTSKEYTGALRYLVGDGIVHNDGSAMAPSANGLVVTVGTGIGWLAGRYGRNKAAKTFSLDAAGAGLKRIDRIVLRADAVARTVSLEVKQGTAAATPSAPALSQTDDLYEIPICSVAVTGGSSATTLTDERTLLYTPSEAVAKMQAITSGTDYVYAVYA